MKAKVLEFKHCLGCGSTSEKCAVLVALPGPQYVCEDCVILMASIVANEAPQDVRIAFVDALVEVLRSPIEVVQQWKAAIAKKVTVATESKGETTIPGDQT